MCLKKNHNFIISFSLFVFILLFYRFYSFAADSSGYVTLYGYDYQLTYPITVTNSPTVFTFSSYYTYGVPAYDSDSLSLSFEYDNFTISSSNSYVSFNIVGMGYIIDGVKYYSPNFLGDSQVGGFSFSLTVARNLSSFHIVKPFIEVSCASNISTSISGTTATNTAYELSSNIYVTFTHPSKLHKYYYVSGDIVSSINSQTDTVTSGFDSSSGDSAASSANSAVTDFNSAEDGLYDMLDYQSPGDITDNGYSDGIMLAGTFMQSLYSSSSFVAKCITYVLVVGVFLFVVGWVKKR